MNDAILKALEWGLSRLPILGRRRVLIVENNRNDRRLLAARIKDLGWEAVGCEHPDDAILLLEEDCDFRVALVDLVFDTGMTGLQFAAELQKRPKWRKIRVTYVTGNPKMLADADSLQHWSFIVKDARQVASPESLRSVLVNGSMASREAFACGFVIAMGGIFVGQHLDEINFWIKHLFKP